MNLNKDNPISLTTLRSVRGAADVLHKNGLTANAVLIHLTVSRVVVLEKRLKKALALVERYGGFEGDHHKAWVIDQMVQCLAGPKYDKFVERYRAGTDGPNSYTYNKGIAP